MRVTCPCGKALKIDDKFAGKKVRCPACKKVFLAEEEEEVVVAKAKPAARDDDDEDEPEEEEERRPKKKKKKKNQAPPTVSPLSGWIVRIVIWGGLAIFAAVVIWVVIERKKNGQ